MRLTIATRKTLIVTLNLPLLKELKRTLSRAMHHEDFDFSYYTEAASDKAVQLMNQGR